MTISSIPPGLGVNRAKSFPCSQREKRMGKMMVLQCPWSWVPVAQSSYPKTTAQELFSMRRVFYCSAASSYRSSSTLNHRTLHTRKLTSDSLSRKDSNGSERTAKTDGRYLHTNQRSRIERAGKILTKAEGEQPLGVKITLPFPNDRLRKYSVS